MSGGSPKTFEAALTVPKGRNITIINIVVMIITSNLTKKGESWAGFIAFAASISPEITNLGSPPGSAFYFFGSTVFNGRSTEIGGMRAA